MTINLLPKKKLKEFIILNKFIIIFIFLTSSCTRYIFYQEKLQKDEAIFYPSQCSKEYALKSEIYLGPKDSIELFKNFRFQKKWGPFETFNSWSQYQQYLRPETLAPSSRAQLFFKTQDKLYYGEAVAKTINDDLTSPLFFLIAQLQNHLKIKTIRSEMMGPLIQDSKVDSSFDFIIKKNQGLLTELKGTQKAIQNFYFKGENIIRPNESYYFSQVVIPLERFNLSPQLYQFTFEEIDLNKSSSHPKHCSQWEYRSPQKYFNFQEQNQNEHWSHQFGLMTQNGDTFLAIISHGELTSNYPKTALLKGKPGPSVPWCFSPNFELLTALDSSNSGQLLQLALKNKKEEKNNFLISLKKPRFIMLHSPFRMVSEYHSEEESQNELKNIPFQDYQIKLQQLPIYHLDKAGQILGIIKNEESQSFFLDGREEHLNLSCPTEALINGQ